MDDTVGYSYMQNRLDSTQWVVLCCYCYFASWFFTSTLITSTWTSQEQKVAPPTLTLKIPSFISIIVNTSIFDPINKLNII